MNNPDEVWPAIMGNPCYGSAMRMCLVLFAQIPAEAISEALRRIEHEISIGPLIDPSAYVDGRRLDNAADYKRVLKAALELRKALPEHVQV